MLNHEAQRGCADRKSLHYRSWNAHYQTVSAVLIAGHPHRQWDTSLLRQQDGQPTIQVHEDRQGVPDCHHGPTQDRKRQQPYHAVVPRHARCDELKGDDRASAECEYTKKVVLQWTWKHRCSQSVSEHEARVWVPVCLHAQSTYVKQSNTTRSCISFASSSASCPGRPYSCIVTAKTSGENEQETCEWILFRACCSGLKPHQNKITEG